MIYSFKNVVPLLVRADSAREGEDAAEPMDASEVSDRSGEQRQEVAGVQGSRPVKNEEEMTTETPADREVTETPADREVTVLLLLLSSSFSFSSSFTVFFFLCLLFFFSSSSCSWAARLNFRSHTFC